MPTRETIDAPPASMAQPLAKLAKLESVLGSALRGKPEAVNLSLVCLLSGGHLLIDQFEQAAAGWIEAIVEIEDPVADMAVARIHAAAAR